jgi:hypothetical protein
MARRASPPWDLRPPVHALADLGEALLHLFLRLKEGLTTPLTGFTRALPDGAPQLSAAAGSEEYTGEDPRRPAEQETPQPLPVQHLCLPPGAFFAHSLILSAFGAHDRDPVPGRCGVQEESGGAAARLLGDPRDPVRDDLNRGV